MRKRRALIIAGASLLLATVFLVWLFSGLGTVRLRPASTAEMLAAVPPELRYEWKEAPEGQNAWAKLTALCAVPIRNPAANFVPPLSDRSLRQIKPFLDEWRWAEPSLDKILDLPYLQAPEHYSYEGEVTTYEAQHPFLATWVYACQKLAYCQAAGPKEDIWPALKRLLKLARLMTAIESGPTIYQEQQMLWSWFDNLRVGLLEPSLTEDQLRECLRLLPTGDDFVRSETRALKIQYHEYCVAYLAPAKQKEFVKDYSNEKDFRRFYAGELDVLRTIRDLGTYFKAQVETIDMPYVLARSRRRATVLSLWGKFPELPWPQPKESSLETWWKEFSYRIQMRGIPNAMVRFLPGFPTWDALEIISTERFWIEAARLCTAIRIFEKKNGHRPHLLEELVQTGILAKLPCDPFSGDPLHYDGTKIWSVGPDLIDDHGTSRSTSGGHVDLVWDFTVHPWP